MRFELKSLGPDSWHMGWDNGGTATVTRGQIEARAAGSNSAPARHIHVDDAAYALAVIDTNGASTARWKRRVPHPQVTP